jgi:hypothetical protein
VSQLSDGPGSPTRTSLIVNHTPDLITDTGEPIDNRRCRDHVVQPAERVPWPRRFVRQSE